MDIIVMDHVTVDKVFESLCSDYAVRSVRKRQKEGGKEKVQRKGIGLSR